MTKPRFVWFDSLRPTNKLSVIKGRVFLCWTSTKLGFMCLAQGHNTVTQVRLEPAAPRSRVKHSSTEALCSAQNLENVLWFKYIYPYLYGHPWIHLNAVAWSFVQTSIRPYCLYDVEVYFFWQHHLYYLSLHHLWNGHLFLLPDRPCHLQP